MHVFITISLLICIFFITGLGDDGMEESGPREAVLVQEADDGEEEEEEETGSRTKTFVFKSR